MTERERFQRAIVAVIPKGFDHPELPFHERVEKAREEILEFLERRYRPKDEENQTIPRDWVPRRRAFYVEKLILQELKATPFYKIDLAEYFHNKKLLDLYLYFFNERPEQLIPKEPRELTDDETLSLAFRFQMEKNHDLPMLFWLFGRHVQIKVGDPIPVQEWLKSQGIPGDKKITPRDQSTALTQEITQRMNALFQRDPASSAPS